jgi:hypothetical protein
MTNSRTTGQHHEHYPLWFDCAQDSDASSRGVKGRTAHILRKLKEEAGTWGIRTRSRSGTLVIEPRMLAHEAPKLGAEKHIEHVRGRTTHHIRKWVLVELEEKGPLGAVKC